MPIQLYKSKSECCGCGACSNVCPQAAISMVEDAFGFIYPQIDPERCIECGLCKRICSFGDTNPSDCLPLHAYAAASTDPNVLRKSTSGGVFAEIAKVVLNRGGIVFGCAFDTHHRAAHIQISSLQDLHRLQGSKYVQSNMMETYIAVKQYLKQGREVLFGGTPCQVSAIKKYLGNDDEKLYCIDIICHGIGSPRMFADDIKYLARGKTVQNVMFRNKKYGWGTVGSIEGEKLKIRYDVTRSPYYHYYLSGAIYRDSCYQCPYPESQRKGDLTLGDYWRVESAHPDIEKHIKTDKGVSCVLVNSGKGQALIENARDNLIILDSKFEKVKARNGQLVHCCKKPVERDEIFDIYEKEGYLGVVKYWKKNSAKSRFVERMKAMVPTKIKKTVKKIIKA